jgi:hypothetical protein
MKIQEVTGIKPLTPDQQRIKAMQARVKHDQEAVKAERAKQKIKAGQNELSKVNRKSLN